MHPLVIPIVFMAMFVQSLTGFGSALIAMPFLIAILGPDVARPAFLLMGQTSCLMFMLKYRHDWQLSDVRQIIVGTLLGIPVGTWVATVLDRETFMLVLGVVIIGYAAYALSNFKLSRLNPRWGTFLGLISGILHSAYNVGGPPLVMYGTSQDWQARRFKGNIQTVFFITGFFIIISHYLAGNITMDVWANVLLMVPTMLIALALGFRAERYIKQDMFRRIVLVLLLCIGVSLIV